MDKMRMETPDLTAQNVERIGALFPNCVTETVGADGKPKKAINFDLLRQMLSGDVVEGDEAYEFTWVGKKAAIVEANKPIRKTLRPCPEESVDWDTTENLYIDGDNLEVLKLLQESYLGKVKMIYIDPPYNTGNDFIYRDDFVQSAGEYAEESGQVDDETGDRLFRNTDSNGRFHSDWCSMMYSRLMLARNLLCDNGVVFVSISEQEYSNLKSIMDEVYGEANRIGTIVWKNATDNNPSNIAEEHEYIIAYAKHKYRIDSVWKSKVSAVKDVLVEIGNSLADKYSSLPELQAAYAAWYKEHKAQLWPLDRYKYIDFGGVYTGSQSVHNPGREGYRYDVIHPVTNKPCKQPLMGYRFPQETMNRLLAQGKILFGKDENKIIELKLYASEYQEKLSSVFELDGRIGPYDLKTLFPELKKAFTNPKPVQLIKTLLSYIVKENDVVLDFFSGSATTAHAVMQLNSEDGGHRKFIMVQIPELCDKKSEAYKAGYSTISEIGKERIRRAGKKIKEENPLTTADLDIGFRVFKLDDTNMQDVYYSADEYDQNMLALMETNIKPDRTDLDLLFGCLLDWGLPLSMPYHSEQIDGCTVHTYNGGDLIACFDRNIPDSVVMEIAKRQPLRAVFQDACFANSPSKINVWERFKLLAPDTRVKVI